MAEVCRSYREEDVMICIRIFLSPELALRVGHALELERKRHLVASLLLLLLALSEKESERFAANAEAFSGRGSFAQRGFGKASFQK